jgi:hypothetical protein
MFHKIAGVCYFKIKPQSGVVFQKPHKSGMLLIRLQSGRVTFWINITIECGIFAKGYGRVCRNA